MSNLNYTFWQPIETAPKDGTFILLRGASGYVSTPYYVEVGRFIPGFRDWWITIDNQRIGCQCQYKQKGPAVKSWPNLLVTAAPFEKHK